MGRILSQGEIDALLNSGGDDEKIGEQLSDRNLVRYNFRRPDRVSPVCNRFSPSTIKTSGRLTISFWCGTMS